MKRAFSILISFAMLLIGFSGLSITANAALQMEGNYYIINSEEDFMAISDLAAKYLIRSNLDLSTYNYTPLGNATTPFSGELIGNLGGVSGAKVSITLNVNSTDANKGLLSYMSGGLAKVENIIMKGSVIGNSNVGSIVGNFVSGSITNCDNYADITATLATGYVGLGGIAGYASSKTANITNCSNYGKITYSGSGNSIGGIVGRNNGPLTLTSCYNKSNISISGTHVGGISGNASKSVIIIKCANVGTIVSTGASGYVGGISGNHNGKITQSFNTGNIKGVANVGGIAGYAYVTSDLEISHCYNTGKVEVSDSSKNVAGICYYIGKTDATSAILTGNYNIGVVSGTAVKNYAIYYGSAVVSGGTQKISSNFLLKGLSNPAVSSGLTQPVELTSTEMQSLSNFQSASDTAVFNSSMWTIKTDDPYGYQYPQLFDNPHREYKLPSTILYNSLNDSYKISWGIDEFATGYLVEVLDDTNTLITETITNNEYSLSVNEILDGKKVYTVKVSAVKSSGNEAIDTFSVDMRYAGGSGIIGNEYQIANLRHLKNISLQSSAVYKQIADIDDPLTEPIPSFSGKYYGNDKYITLQINKDKENAIGLFSLATGSTIDGIITKGSVKGYKYVGAIAGQGVVTVSNCINKADVIAENDGVGGIIGYAMTDSNLSYCANLKNVVGNNGVGGIAGFSYGKISYSYNLGNITAVSATGGCGGITGGVRFNGDKGEIKNCYNTGIITGTYSTGIAFCGFDTGLNLISCYSIGEANYPIGYNTNINATYSVPNCYYLTNGSTDSKANEVSLSGLSDISLGDAFVVYNLSEIYKYPQIKDNLQEEPYQITILTITVQNAGGTVNKVGTRYVKKNAAYQLNIIPEYTYIIEDIKFNSNSIGSNIIGEFSINPVINDPSIIEVSFKDRPIDVIPGSIVPDSEAANQMVPENYNEPLVFDEELTITTPYGVAFSKVLDYYGYTLKEYGMIFSKTNGTLEIGEIGTYKAQGKVARNALGQYGVLFYGKGIEKDTTYFIKAYAIYTNGTTDYVIYGDKIELTTAK